MVRPNTLEVPLKTGIFNKNKDAKIQIKKITDHFYRQ